MNYSNAQALVFSVVLVTAALTAPIATQAASVDHQTVQHASDNSIAIAALHQAIEDAKTRLKQFHHSQQAVGLTQTSEDLNGNILQRKFTPTAYHNNEITGEWQTLRADEKFNDSITVSDQVIFDSTNIDLSSAQFLQETQSTWVFKIANIINVQSNDDSAEQELEQIDNAMTEHLFTEVIIDKKSPKIKAIKIYTRATFKPSWMLTIEKFELRLNYSEAWRNGPLIRKSMTRHVKGQYGWLVSIDELITTELTEVKKMNLAALQ
ncbi:hypothetical protein [Thalassotalea atypica]|uniref:hypothetical protein n=1 Tax=Thalassotalea atypica TaxID=2054316 RepID=UPI00257449A0|nr:hypothetical protein [Thalassotalea atypica]